MMREHQTKKERLTIYLVKDAKLRDEQIVKTDRTKPVIGLKISSGSASLYVKDGPPPKIPAWTAFLVENQDVPEHLFLGDAGLGSDVFPDNPAVLCRMASGNLL